MPFRDTPMDPLSRQTFARSIEALAEEFRGIYSLETIERYVNESIDRLSGARVVDFIPLFVHRFSREQLRALAQAEGAIAKDVPEVLFVCVHNAGRSQMAAALLDHHAKGRVHVRSAGSDPGDQINPAVVAAMDEWGIDLSREFPKPLTDEFVRAADAVITMGCGDACPIYPGKRYEDWEPASRWRWCAASATTSTSACSSCWPSWSRPAPDPTRRRVRGKGERGLAAAPDDVRRSIRWLPMGEATTVAG
jgi:arsenate reductase (thioredoxin)